MVKQYKIDKVEELVSKLNKKNNIILTNYSGIKVSEINSLRKKLQEENIDYKVIKNNLFKKAWENVSSVNIDEHLKGPIAIAFTNDDLSTAAKILKSFKKEQNNFQYSIGIMKDIIYNNTEINKISEIPSKDVLISQIMSLINSGANNLALIINQTIATLARGINEVAKINAS